MELRPTCLALIGFVLVACGTSIEPEHEPSAVLTGTVVETADGTVLCDGPVAESAPPQCDGPRLDSWEWAQAWTQHGTEGGRWGEFCFLGERNGADHITVVGDPRPAGTCDLPEITGHVSVIDHRSDGQYICLGPFDAFAPQVCSDGSHGGPDRRLPIADWSWPEGAEFFEAGRARQAGFIVHGVIDEDGQFVLTREPTPTSPHDSPPTSPLGCGRFADDRSQEPSDVNQVAHARLHDVPELDIDPTICDDVPWDSPLVTAAEEAAQHEEFVQHYLSDGVLIVWLRVDDPSLLPALQRVAGADAVQVHASFEPVDAEIRE